MINVKIKYLALVFLVPLFFYSCDEVFPEAPAENELLDGPMEDLAYSEQNRFLAGDVAFNDEVFTPENGLGPIFVATSCGSCHPGDGKGHPFTTLTRFGQTSPNQSNNIPPGAPQLQNRAIPGFEPERLPSGVPFMKFTPPAVTGLGLLAVLTDAQILENADPNDDDGDGISGVPNYITPPDYFQPQWFHQSFSGKYIGRFGKKAAAIDLLQQTATAYNQDMGVTSTFEPLDVATNLSVDPEVSDQTIRDVVFYLRTLKAPIQRESDASDVIRGQQIFTDIKCGSCHIPSWTTPESDIGALSNKTFYPYTDLLLHNMGPGLDDGATEGSAETYEWRTPPLWGLGLSQDSQGGELFLMHDGRAKTIKEAINMHGGEASISRDSFEQLSETDKQKLLTFLKSL
ncbi:thiol oxidoreductase [Fulvivirga sp. RKSG066]|uniref:di-heme oxidoredictase family protein n=1 Tax=Fulvivirga aurantia TaxID=2529383 RepID=UPI0012BC867E|nr:di-heme oxidoredictase family protein [Fulvivirga aurantia]MTI22965.1 thiol oxidoreductase [Fulvivirga aurantia]